MKQIVTNHKKNMWGSGDSCHSAVLLLWGMSGHGNSQAMRYSEHQNDNQVDILGEGRGNTWYLEILFD